MGRPHASVWNCGRGPAGSARPRPSCYTCPAKYCLSSLHPLPGSPSHPKVRADLAPRRAAAQRQSSCATGRRGALHASLAAPPTPADRAGVAASAQQGPACRAARQAVMAAGEGGGRACGIRVCSLAAAGSAFVAVCAARAGGRGRPALDPLLVCRLRRLRCLPHHSLVPLPQLGPAWAKQQQPVQVQRTWGSTKSMLVCSHLAVPQAKTACAHILCGEGVRARAASSAAPRGGEPRLSRRA